MLVSQLKTVVKTTLSFLGIYKDWLLERVGVGKLQSGWLDYNHLYVFGKSLHQQEYKVLRKGLEAGLIKQHVSNFFNSQEGLDISPLTVIEKFSGARNGKIQNNLLLLDDCFLGNQSKSE